MDFWDFAKAFLVGGGLCVVGQLLIDFTKITPARVLVTFVVAGIALTAVGAYGPLIDFAGAGATVPLMGFGYALAEGVKKAVDQNSLLGAFMGGLTATAAGITAAVVFGYLTALVTKSRDKS